MVIILEVMRVKRSCSCADCALSKFGEATVKNVSIWWWRRVDTMMPDEFYR
jgi:hypothetical protein